MSVLRSLLIPALGAGLFTSPQMIAPQAAQPGSQISKTSTDHRAAGKLMLDDPDRACAQCHKDIYERYKGTAMARGSGIATDGLIQGEFTHATSGIRYKLVLRDGQAWMIYDR